jgi:hypothetical protein
MITYYNFFKGNIFHLKELFVFKNTISYAIALFLGQMLGSMTFIIIYSGT